MNGHFKGGYVPVPKRHEKELKRLEKEKRRFKLALRDKGSNKALKEFCIEGLKRIEAEVTRLKSQ